MVQRLFWVFFFLRVSGWVGFSTPVGLLNVKLLGVEEVSKLQLVFFKSEQLQFHSTPEDADKADCSTEIVAPRLKF